MACGCSSGYNGSVSCNCKTPMRTIQLAILFFLLSNPATTKFLDGTIGIPYVNTLLFVGALLLLNKV